MATPSYTRSLASSVKRLRLSSTAIAANQCQTRCIQQSSRPAASVSPSLETELGNLRLPKAVQATYLNPLKRSREKGYRDPACELHLHSYSVRNLEMFADFAVRAAYFLNLHARGPSPLPRKTERWTVPRSNFVHKKSQENFERITMKRKITILNGHPDTVAIWLAFLRKHQYYGIGMKANIYEHGDLNAAQDLDKEAQRLEKILGAKKLLPEPSKREEMHGPMNTTSVLDESFKAQWGAYAAMGGAPSVGGASQRIDMIKLPPPGAKKAVGYSRARGHEKAVYKSQ
ncbi:hypothetical protein AC579_8113 [Pseudocercospora musae]|uniref:Small ribosomal subunit protein uS10m n=1 Tax=Pseudocercospora musae TaxID=113226 RepID=A0A139IG21_9PEZI|nr:hypothetical protein AC579_8113 [Pseudocercospora musae]